jgi:hypothetical protein
MPDSQAIRRKKISSGVALRIQNLISMISQVKCRKKHVKTVPSFQGLGKKISKLCTTNNPTVWDSLFSLSLSLSRVDWPVRFSSKAKGSEERNI